LSGTLDSLSANSAWVVEGLLREILIQSPQCFCRQGEEWRVTGKQTALLADCQPRHFALAKEHRALQRLRAGFVRG
jgi:hypothetical protein